MLRDEELTVAVGRLLGSSCEVESWTAEPAPASTGRATGRVHHLAGTARLAGQPHPQPWRLVVKTLRAPDGTDRDADALVPDHWTYWEREALAYALGVLPDGREGLTTVRCLGVFRGAGRIAIALAEAPPDRFGAWNLDHYAEAARRLGAWQAGWYGHAPPLRWLAADQLAQRVHRTDARGGLGLPRAGLPEGLVAAWEARWTVLDGLAAVPAVLSHGDFSRGNLSFSAHGELFVLDWATLGHSPPGFDLAHLTLSAMVELGPFVAPNTIADVLVDAYGDCLPGTRRGFFGAAMLVGISRLCWTLNRINDPSVVDRWHAIAAWLGGRCQGDSYP